MLLSNIVGCNHQVAPVTVSANRSHPSPQKESSFYPSSVVLSPIKNKELSHATDVHYSNAQSHTTKGTHSTSTVTSTGISYQNHGQTSYNKAFVSAVATNTNSSILFNSAVPSNSTTNQTSLLNDNVLDAPAPPPLNNALQPRLFKSQHDGGRLPSGESTSSANILKQPVLEQSVNAQDGVCKDPSSELVEQHNVRVVPAVLSFDSPSLFSPSTEQSSLSRSNIVQSSSENLVNNSSSKAVSLSQPLSDNHCQTAHPQVNSSRTPFSNMSPQWVSGKSPYMDNQVCALIYKEYIVLHLGHL